MGARDTTTTRDHVTANRGAERRRPTIRRIALTSVAYPRSAVMRIHRRQSAHPVFLAALNAAYSSKPDDVAILALREVVARHPKAASVALQTAAEIARGRDEFDTDRTHRLLDAALSGGAVRPMAEDRRERFTQEQRLGHMTLEDAFDYLAELCPEIRPLADRARACAAGAVTSPPGTWSHEASSILARTGAAEPLLASALALSAIAAYLEAVERADAIAINRSWFALPGKVLILSTTFCVPSSS